MAEYIDRDRFARHLEMCIDNVRNTNGVTEDFEICLRALKNQPTVDAAEVIHAHWAETEATMSTKVVFCTNCLATYKFQTNDIDLFDYCPRCGAKMDEIDRGCEQE
jgi:Zn finger protein HypA/HybF involved in hydrogenase expression